MWGSHVFYQQYSLNQALDCSHLALSGCLLEEAAEDVPPLFTPFAPAMQYYKQKSERSGGVWEKGLEKEGEGNSKKKTGVKSMEREEGNMLRSSMFGWNSFPQWA